MAFRVGQAEGSQHAIALSRCTDFACRAARTTRSPEQQVRSVIDSMELAAEARDVGDLMEHVSAAYRSADGQDRGGTSRYVRGYFVANQSIHLLTRIESLEFPAPDEARVKLQVGMAGRGGQGPPTSTPTSTTSMSCWCARTASGKSATRTGARIDAGVDLCNMQSILRVVFNEWPAQRSAQRKC